ncbi:MAG: endonuclease/exonuclease/phosphatase family protein, partial [Bacteroidota bacterium]|nr:endonuclease/exonuclease/phosphatase family protein [Bacteroidota bacterium]
MKKIILLFLIALAFLPAGNSQIKNSILVAAYNLRYANSNDGINSWTNRKDQVKGLIQFHNFDIFGTEEGLMEQLNDIAQLKQYAFIGEGRDGGIKGEHSAIFYRKTRFKLLDSGNFWLSETPEKPSYGWDAKHCRRICSWGKFKDLQSNKEFCFFCVHFDNEGIEAQRQSAKLMV